MAKIKLGEQEFNLKYTIESWKKLKEKHDITPTNFNEKVKDDFAGTVSKLVFYGLSPKDREVVKIEDIDSTFGFEVMDQVNEAIEESMPKRTEKDRADGSSGESSRS